MIKPLGERIVVEKVAVADTLIPEHLIKDNLILCVVLRTPPDLFVPEKGQTVLIPKNALRDVNVGGEVSYIVNLRDVYAVVD